MSAPQPKIDLYLSWIALILVSGEFAVAGCDLLYHGHALALYMAFNALVRETRGGMHYHEIVLHLFRGLYGRNTHWSTVISLHPTHYPVCVAERTCAVLGSSADPSCRSTPPTLASPL
jgi:hypothetical protein